MVQVRKSNLYRPRRSHPMRTDCTPIELAFKGLGRRAVVGRFDGGRLTTDGGVLPGPPATRGIEHRLETLVAQRVLALAAGYEDLNDHDRLRADSAFALAALSMNRASSGSARLPASILRCSASRDALSRWRRGGIRERQISPPSRSTSFWPPSWERSISAARVGIYSIWRPDSPMSEAMPNGS